MKMKRGALMRWSWLAFICGAILLYGVPVWSQDETSSTEETETSEDVPITGGLTYEPIRDPEERLRDPFKSPFEIEEEEKERQQQDKTLTDRGEVEEYDIGELDLRGIYLDPRTGYWAIFKIGDEYDWFQVGVKFRDGDLVNITDSAVVFKNYISEDATQVREVTKELHRGEE